ncbi:HAD family hydrolase [Sporosarcina sp. P21c]|uniref:HAD family hydrolase n=1 Tax=Sporosarcina TaxID=1569 RepID=UPI000A16B745|nr:MULTISPECIES: HAD family hydrolase [Sporosarcina]ARJ39609.1 HAD family hydrolase [Sporosarcina ureae]PIC68020.1 HAD family hydrolase [Sporosarcina sp. P16a]PIC83117.1 HAD family hydrolase [Sporosarcina sp. P1]PIC90945.1 HAD family hydrolase [Sporosarcina sp. P21c]PIC94329.1 HAD family hydrolase [Sporosarcina sp. P25]
MKFPQEDIQSTILFDKDGTLIDLPSVWLPWIEDVDQYLSNSISNYPYQAEGIKHLIGINKQDGTIDPKGPLAIGSVEESVSIIAFLLYTKGMSWDSALLYARDSVDYANERQNHSPFLQLVEGIEELLIQLTDKGYNLGVLTADDTDKANEQLDRLNILKYFNFVIGSDLVERSKPFPDLAYAARDRYGVKLENSVMIGDTNADIQLGKSAGVKFTIGIVSYTGSDVTHLREADLLIHNYSELLSWSKEAK